MVKCSISMTRSRDRPGVDHLAQCFHSEPAATLRRWLRVANAIDRNDAGRRTEGLTMNCQRHVTRFVFGALALVLPTVAVAQPFVYPARGQSPQQQEFDRGQCYSWAVQQTGFDPANPRIAIGPPPPQSAPGPDGSMLRGAAGGAALGAIGGAIGGDAGKGAAIGAGVGGLFGGFRRMRQLEEEQ